MEKRRIAAGESYSRRQIGRTERLICLSIQISRSSLRRPRQLSRPSYTVEGSVKRLPLGSYSRGTPWNPRDLSFSFFFFSLSPFLPLLPPFSLFLTLFLVVQARRSNSKNLEDDPIRRRDQRGRYDRAEKSYLASAIARMGLGNARFSSFSFRDVEWHNLVAIAAVHRAAESARGEGPALARNHIDASPGIKSFLYVRTSRAATIILIKRASRESGAICASGLIKDYSPRNSRSISRVVFSLIATRAFRKLFSHNVRYTRFASKWINAWCRTRTVFLFSNYVSSNKSNYSQILYKIQRTIAIKHGRFNWHIHIYNIMYAQVYRKVSTIAWGYYMS